MPLMVDPLSLRRTVAICGLVLGLGGCVAAPLLQPLAQMALSRPTPTAASPSCAGTPSSCSPPSDGAPFAEMSHNFGQSFRKLTGIAADDQQPAANVPVR